MPEKLHYKVKFSILKKKRLKKALALFVLNFSLIADSETRNKKNFAYHQGLFVFMYSPIYTETEK